MGHFPTQSEAIEQTRQSLDVTNALLAAIATTDPIQSLTSRISSLCHGSAVIYDKEGKIFASTGEAPTQLIWNATAETHHRELSLVIGRWSILTRRVSLQDGIHVIAIASRSEKRIEHIGEVLLDTSERVLSAVLGIQHGATLRDRRDSEELIASLHDGILPSREHRFWSRMSQFRFHTYAPVRAVEISTIDGSSIPEQDSASLVSKARADDIPFIAMLRRAEVDARATLSAIVEESSAGKDWLGQIAKTYLIGTSAPFSVLAQTPHGVREAETALDIAKQWAANTTAPDTLGPVLIDRIDLPTWLLSHVDQRQLRARIEQTLQLLPSASLKETLISYLIHDQHIVHTADAMFVHPNTIRYRLSRIEEATGLSISSATAIASFVLALYPDIVGKSLDKNGKELSQILSSKK